MTIFLGAVLGIILVVFDEFLKAKGSFWRFPAIALAIGIYMPLDVTIPLFIGGLVWLISEKRLFFYKERVFANYVLLARRRGLLFSSGLIAGEALMGIILAIPFAAYQTTTLFAIVPKEFKPIATVLGAMCMLFFVLYLYYISSSVKLKK